LRKYLSTDLHYEVIVACTNQEGLLWWWTSRDWCQQSHLKQS
jgi:hypothetical protein